MEKIFATVLSLAIMVALVAGVMSLINDDDSKEKKNYIDLNEINEAGSENDELTGLQNANNETTKAFEANELAKNETTEAPTDEPSTESGRWFDRDRDEDATESTSEAGAEAETVTESETK